MEYNSITNLINFKDNIANEFSTTNTYQPGDYAIYQGKLCRIISSTAKLGSALGSGDYVQTTIALELQRLANLINSGSGGSSSSTTTYQRSDELLANITIQDDYFVDKNTNGYPIALSGCNIKLSDYISIPNDGRIIIDTIDLGNKDNDLASLPDAGDGTTSRFNYYYDSSKNPITNGGFTFNMGQENIITPPSTAAFFRISVLNNWISTSQKIKVYTETPISG